MLIFTGHPPPGGGGYPRQPQGQYGGGGGGNTTVVVQDRGRRDSMDGLATGIADILVVLNYICHGALIKLSTSLCQHSTVWYTVVLII